jgi:hypothetical protein
MAYIGQKRNIKIAPKVRKLLGFICASAKEDIITK